MLSDDLGKKKSWQKVLNFGMWALFRPRSIALKFFRWVALRFQEIMYAKNALVSLCYDKLSRSFVIISQRRPLFKVKVSPRFIITRDRLARIARTLIT